MSLFEKIPSCIAKDASKELALCVFSVELRILEDSFDAPEGV